MTTAANNSAAGAAWQPDGELDDVRLTGLDVGEVVASGMRLLDVEITAGRFTGTGLERSTWRDCRVSGIRMIGVALGRSRWDNSRLDECSVAGCELFGVTWRRLTLRGCVLDGVNLRQAHWQELQLVDCRLREVDLADARLIDVRFERCTLEAVDLSRAELDRVDLRSSSIRLSRGWERLRGAVIDHGQLFDIAPALASALGIRVED